MGVAEYLWFMQRKAYVYKIVNKTDGSIYIGKAANPQKRWRQHVEVASTPLVRAMVEQGIDNFSFEVVAECANDNAALEEEKQHIVKQLESGAQVYNERLPCSLLENKPLPRDRSFRWTGKVYRCKGNDVWFTRYRDECGVWRSKRVPSRIQDHDEALAWMSAWMTTERTPRVLQ